MGVGGWAEGLLPKKPAGQHAVLSLPEAADRDGQPYRETEASGDLTNGEAGADRRPDATADLDSGDET